MSSYVFIDSDSDIVLYKWVVFYMYNLNRSRSKKNKNKMEIIKLNSRSSNFAPLYLGYSANELAYIYTINLDICCIMNNNV